MGGTNGAAAAADTYDDLQRREHEERSAKSDQDAAGAGWAIQGEDPYAGEWDINLDMGECPDPSPAPGAALDAQLLERMVRSRGKGKLREVSVRRQHITSFEQLQDYRLSFTDRHSRLRESWPFADAFAYGQGVGGYGSGGLMGQYIPLLPGPVTRQLYWADYFGMSAKAFEAYNHDPISWRCVHMKQEFALGKGLQGRVTKSTGDSAGQSHDTAQGVWDEFWKRNKMDNRLDMMARDLSILGEQFLRFFKAGSGKLTVRSLDPASIYDLITDQEDIETVYGYHQQFQTPYQLYAPPYGLPMVQKPPEGPTDTGATTRYIIRQIAAAEVDHYKINSGAYERRGRSDLYPALGWIKRLRDYLTAHVIKADMLARICWDLKVDGNQPAINRQRQALFPGGRAPAPGTVFGHNSASELSVIAQPGGAGVGGRWDPIMDALVTMVSNSIGLPKDWLGFGQGTTRASALVATEPAARSLEELQGTIEAIIYDTFDRVMAAAGITDAALEVTFPSIATEDRTQKLSDLAFSVANNWLSSQTAGEIAAKELGISTYDWDEEQSRIAAQWEKDPDDGMEDVPDAEPDPVTGKTPQRPKRGDGVMRSPMIVASMRQARMLDPTKAPTTEDQPPGVLVPTNGDTPVMPGAAGAAAAPTRNGFPGDENPMSKAGAANIKGDAAGKAKEAGMVQISTDDLMALVREAAGRGGRRRRPDDPAFVAASEQYDRGTESNLATLAASVRD